MLKHKSSHSAALLRSAAVAATALALCACGGGGGGGGGIASTPPPQTSTPTPSPTPTPAAASIGAPARATTAGSTAPVVASLGGPNFTSGPAAGTVFPALQTTMVYAENAAPRADSAANAAGGTATVIAGVVTPNIADFSIADARSSWAGHADLDWTRVGSWSTGGGVWDYDGLDGRSGVYVVGYETPASAMPASGSATYTGAAQAIVFVPGTNSGAIRCDCVIYQVSGNASFSANFGARTLTGALTNMAFDDGWGGGIAWNDVAFTSTIAGGAFSGTTSVTSAPSGSLAANATGTLEGRFFGPSAQEAGAVWTLFDGTRAAIGTLSAKRP